MDSELTPHDRAQRQILHAWEDTPMESRLTFPEMQEAANLAIAALRHEGLTAERNELRRTVRTLQGRIGSRSG